MFAAVLCAVFLAVTVHGQDSEFEKYKQENPMEFSGKYQGDIDISSSGAFRNALVGARLWYNNVVIYDDKQMSPYGQDMIRRALNEITQSTGGCIRFKRRTSANQQNFVNIFSGDGCYSQVGMVGGAQKMSLNEQGCVHSVGTIQHEFLHALGFMHEQCRSDRDRYLRINWDNIQRNMAFNFDKANTNNQDSRYTYASIMHYGKFAFSANGRPTMVPVQAGAQIGTRKLHNVDIKRLKILYGC
ncbi:hatching enzyme 1.2-like [Tubulanus polymorphus]|uniref:hatching enzyme 1.2-like n=1 Tax=Tubulanus polymorphus TaxID=672921 RepID=UPI003DA27D79